MFEREPALKVVLVYSPAPRQTGEWALDLPDGSTVADALEAARTDSAAADLPAAPESIGVWGRRCGPEQTLQDGDRIEIYRGLRVDPKVARRERFNKQGAKGTGLFAAVRPGGKAGY